MSKIRIAKYQIGQIVRHRIYPFRGVVFDIDPSFDNTDEWYESIPAEIRPHKDQPFYHLFAENEETEYVAYVSEQNLLAGYDRRAGAPSAGRRGLRQGRQGRLSPAHGLGSLAAAKNPQVAKTSPETIRRVFVGREAIRS